MDDLPHIRVNLKVEAVGSSEILANTYSTTHCYNLGYENPSI
jgi:hypothetical protein